jgi:23S rRNA A2030 N6-methylase RlmJ
VANTHPANLGDVLKHLVLCELLMQRPARYLESHGGRYIYDLTDENPGTGGVWDLQTIVQQSPAVGRTAYAMVALENAGTPQWPGTYLGSLALADRLLPLSTPVIAAEIKPATRRELERAPWRRSPDRVELSAGIEGQELVAREARSGDLVLIDPFELEERSAGGLSSYDAFDVAVERGATTLLWYPITQPPDAPFEPFDEEAYGRRPRVNPINFTLYYRAKAAGLWGCGVVIDNLADVARKRTSDLLSDFFDGVLALDDYVFTGTLET